MDVFTDIRIPMPAMFESPSLTRIGRFQRGILTTMLILLPILQAIQWQLRKQDYNMEFRCTVRDGVTETSEQEEISSRRSTEYRQKYTSVSQRMFLIFVAVNLLIVCLYMSYVWERFNSWLKLKTTKQRGKIVAEFKASTSVFKAYSLQLCVKLVSAVAFVLYNCVESSVVLPSQMKYRKQWTPLPFVFGSNSFDAVVNCHADQAFQSSMFNIALLTFATFSGAMSLTEFVYICQETKAFMRISDYYFCMFLLRHNSVTQTTKMLIEKELFLEEQRETILARVRKKLLPTLPLLNPGSGTNGLPSITSTIFVSQRKLKYNRVKKQKHKQELFRTYSRTQKIPVFGIQNLFKPGKDAPNPKKILLTGDPGIGKTELVFKLVQIFNSGLLSVESDMHDLEFIFCFDFKELDVIDDRISLQELLNYFAFSSKLGDDVYRQIEANPDEVLLIFDGLNEWTAKCSTDRETLVQTGERMSVPCLVFKLLSGELLPGSTILVTSRSTSLDSKITEIITFDRHAELGSFKPDEVKTGVQEFFRDNKPLSLTLTNRISGDENLEVLCRVPQNCLILCLFVDSLVSSRTLEELQTLELPSTTTELFKRLIESVTATDGDKDNHKKIPSDHFDFSNNYQEVLQKLSYLAFLGINQERYLFRKEDFSFVQLSTFEVEILEHAGFLRRLGGNFPKQSGFYIFSCLSIQEYLAATRIVQSNSTGDFRDFLERANESHFNTLLFVAGLCKDGKKGKGVFVCLMQHLTEAIKLNSFAGEPAIENQAITFLCKCLFENGTQLGHPFAREATSSVSVAKPIAFTELGANPREMQAILYCLKEAMGGNVKRVIFESNAIGDNGFRQVASSICEAASSGLEQMNLTSSSITDDGMLSFLEITARHSFLGLKILGLRGNEISCEGAKYLACVLFNDWCQLEELHLGNNKIGDLGVEYFSEALCSGNSKIQTLDLSSNGITHNGIFYLSKALSNPLCNVRRLYLQKNKIMDFGMQDICEALCAGECNLRILFASSNEITDDGIMFVEKALAHRSCGLQELYLGYNQVTDKGVRSLLQALPNHQFSLKVLSLASNPITDAGVKMLANALRNSSCNLHRLRISLGRTQVATTKTSKLQVRYVNAF